MRYVLNGGGSGPQWFFFLPFPSVMGASSNITFPQIPQHRAAMTSNKKGLNSKWSEEEKDLDDVEDDLDPLKGLVEEFVDLGFLRVQELTGYWFKNRDWCWLGLLSPYAHATALMDPERVISRGEVHFHWSKRRGHLLELGKALFKLSVATDFMENPTKSSNKEDLKYVCLALSTPSKSLNFKRWRDADYAETIALVVKQSQFMLHIRERADYALNNATMVEVFYIFQACVFLDSGRDYSAVIGFQQALLTAARIDSYTNTDCLDVFEGLSPKVFFREYGVKYEYKTEVEAEPPTITSNVRATVEIWDVPVAQCFGDNIADTQMRCDEIMAKITTVQSYCRDLLAMNAVYLSKTTRVEDRIRVNFDCEGFIQKELGCTKQELEKCIVNFALPPMEGVSAETGIRMKVPRSVSLLVWNQEVVSAAVHRQWAKANLIALRRFCAAKIENRTMMEFIKLDHALFAAEILDVVFNYYPGVPYEHKIFASRIAKREASKNK